MSVTSLGSRKFTAVSTIVLILAATAGLSAQNNVWQGSGTGTTAPDPNQPGVDCDLFAGWGGGQVGNYTAEGCHVLNADFSFNGSATWTNVSGDTLNVTYDGQIFPSDDPDFPFGFTGTLFANGGTGDLANAQGIAFWSGGFSGVPGNFQFSFDGTLNTAGNFHSLGLVKFSNIQGSLGNGEPAPYVATGFSFKLGGFFVQTGSILPTSAPEFDPIQSTPETTVLHFNGVQGPNPVFFGLPLHVYWTRHGLIFCHWQALFTVEIDNATGNAVFSGDGHFTVVGGTGWYHDATGSFQTLFRTGTVPAGANNAVAIVRQDGRIDR